MLHGCRERESPVAPAPLDPKILAALGLSALMACDDGKGKSDTDSFSACLSLVETDSDTLGPCLDIAPDTDETDSDTLGPCLDIAPDTDETDTLGPCLEFVDTDTDDSDTDDTDLSPHSDTDDTDSIGPCLDFPPDTDDSDADSEADTGPRPDTAPWGAHTGDSGDTDFCLSFIDTSPRDTHTGDTGRRDTDFCLSFIDTSPRDTHTGDTGRGDTDTFGPCLDTASPHTGPDTGPDSASDPGFDSDSDTDDTDLGPCLSPPLDTDLSPCLDFDSGLAANTSPPRPAPRSAPVAPHLARVALLRELIAKGVLPPDLAPEDDTEET
jgi:hypothetical protein